MSAGKNGLKAVVNATVTSQGEVFALGKRYWCTDLPRFRGWKVEVRIHEDDDIVQVWRGHHYLCSPTLIDDTGFSDAEGARLIALQTKALRDAVLNASKEDRVFHTLGLFNFADEDDPRAIGCPAIQRTGDPDRDRVAQASGANPLALSRTLARCGASMRRIAQARRSRSTQGQKLQEQNRKPNRRPSSSVSEKLSERTQPKPQLNLTHCLSGLAVLTLAVVAAARRLSK